MLHIMHRVYGPALPAAILLIGIGAMGIAALPLRAAPRLAKLARRMRCGFVRSSLRTCRKPRNA